MYLGTVQRLDGCHWQAAARAARPRARARFRAPTPHPAALQAARGAPGSARAAGQTRGSRLQCRRAAGAAARLLSVCVVGCLLALRGGGRVGGALPLGRPSAQPSPPCPPADTASTARTQVPHPTQESPCVLHCVPGLHDCPLLRRARAVAGGRQHRCLAAAGGGLAWGHLPLGQHVQAPCAAPWRPGSAGAAGQTRGSRLLCRRAGGEAAAQLLRGCRFAERERRSPPPFRARTQAGSPRI
jgi:hypothetical protein